MMREVSLIVGSIITCAGSFMALVAFGAGVHWAAVGHQPFHDPQLLFTLSMFLALTGAFLIAYGREEL